MSSLAMRRGLCQCSRRLSPAELHPNALSQSRIAAQHFYRASSRRISNHSTRRKDRNWSRLFLFVPVGALSAYLLLSTNSLRTPNLSSLFGQTAFAEERDATFEAPKSRKGLSKEENRDLISSQHLQVKKSWENPGLYAWGSNSSKVAAPESDEQFVKTPRRLQFFDGMLLRDVKLDRSFGAAVDEKGDLIQWGDGYSKDLSNPTKTLVGKNLLSIEISRDRIIGLNANGQVFSIPVSKTEQTTGPKLKEGSWIPFWSSRPNISYRMIEVKNLSWGERICSIKSGVEHVLLLTSSGKLFAAASGTEDFPSRGQLGIPGLTWKTRPEGSYDQPHEITTLRGFEITRIAAGDYHSLAVDKEGRVFSFGDNTNGQLGFDYNPEAAYVDAPALLSLQRLYSGTNSAPKVVTVAAGGSNSFFSVDATRVAGQSEAEDRQRDLGRITADVWSCGQGIQGTLGNGKWTHVQGKPTKIPALSGLFEYDEKNKTVIPIRLSHLSVGSSHASAVLDNVTHVAATNSTSENDTNWGADVLWWGGNEFYQLGTGKRNNVATPIYIAPMDIEADKEKGRREEHRFQITPRKTVNIKGRRVSVEQRVECGRGVTAVYSGL